MTTAISQSSAPVVRHAHRGDALCLGILATQVFLDTYAIAGIRPAIAREALRAFSTAELERLLVAPGICILAAEIDSHLVGFAQFTIGTCQPICPAAQPAELDRLYVQEPFTGRRVGSRLLMEAERTAVARGAATMWLTPWVHNLRARAFYASHGYDDIGTVEFDLDGEMHENRVLTKTLRAG